MVVKKCSGPCGKEYDLSSFRIRKRKAGKKTLSEADSNGFYYRPTSWCINCEKENLKLWRVENRDRELQKNRNNYSINKTEISKKRKIERETKKQKSEYIDGRKNKPKKSKEQIKLDSQKYYINNIIKIKSNRRNRYFKDKEKVHQYYIEHRESILENSRNRIVDREKENAKTRERRKDPLIKLRTTVSSLVRFYLKSNGSSKNNSSVKLYLGYSIEELKTHIESLFEPWMNWENHGLYRIKDWNDDDITTWKWQLDHIIPQVDLPYKSMEDENFKKCWALSNLRPLSAKQNVLNGSKLARIRHKKKEDK